MKIANKYNFYIRLNCGYNSGMGHFSRAQRLINILGVRKTTLILDSNNYQLDKYRKFNKIFLYDHPKKFSSETLDAYKFIKIIKNKKNVVVIVDDYRLSKKWEKLVSKYCLKMICIDDFIKRTHFSDYYINTKPNLYRLDGKTKKQLINNNRKNCKFLVGPEYYLLNPKIKKIVKTEKKFSLTFYNGSSGSLEIYKKIIQKMLLEKDRNIKINLIVGIYSKNNISKIFSSNEIKRINILENQNNLNKILNNTDLLISSAGVILFEAAFLEVPTILITFNKNQNVSSKSMEYLGHYFILKKKDLKNTEIILRLIKVLKKNINKVKNLVINKKFKFKKNKIKLISELNLYE